MKLKYTFIFENFLRGKSQEKLFEKYLTAFVVSFQLRENFIWFVGGIWELDVSEQRHRWEEKSQDKLSRVSSL